MPILMKRKDGTLTPFRNAEYLPAYYFIPKRIIKQCGKELNSIPRNPKNLIRNYEAVAVVESDLFIELMSDAYAFMVWPFMYPGEYMEAYSGYDPAYIFAHSPAYWVQEMLDEKVLPQPTQLLRFDWNIDWMAEEEVSAVLSWIVPRAMARHNMGPTIATAKEYRCFEDFDTRYSNQKVDFIENGIIRRHGIRRFLWKDFRLNTRKNTTVRPGILRTSHRTSRTNPR